MTTYAQQKNWRDIQRFLPAEYQLRPEQEPQEEWWSWGPHRIHLDCYRNAVDYAQIPVLANSNSNRQLAVMAGIRVNF